MVTRENQDAICSVPDGDDGVDEIDEREVVLRVLDIDDEPHRLALIALPSDPLTFRLSIDDTTPIWLEWSEFLAAAVYLTGKEGVALAMQK